MPDKIPELRDWRVRIPLIADDGRPDFDVVFRVPAATKADAEVLAVPVALHAAEETRTVVNLPDLELTDVDDEPSIDEVRHIAGEAQAEVAYLRKVLAALAEKFPMMLLLTEDEFNAADGDQLAASPGPDGLMAFITNRTFGAMMDQRAARERDAEPLLLPAYDIVKLDHQTFALPGMMSKQVQVGSTTWLDNHGALSRPERGNISLLLGAERRNFTYQHGDTLTVRDAQPDLDGEEQDPDVRRCRARNTGIFDRIEVLHERRWYGLEKTEIRTNGNAVMFLEGAEPVTVPLDKLVTVRPSSWTGNGSQLALPQVIDQQVLLDGEWRTIVGGARMADRDGWVEVVTKTDGTEPASTAVECDDEFQIRNVQARWDR